MSSVEQVLSEAMKLSPAEREQLAELLVAQERDPATRIRDDEYEAAWRAELGERLAAADRGELAIGDWRDVIDRARERSRRQPE